MKKPQKSKTLRALQVGLLASTLLAAPAFGARLAYEGFDYTEANGTTITGLNGGTGWDEAFPAPTGGSMTLQPGLSYSGITTVGKAMRWTPSSTTTQGRDWELNPIAAPADGTYWFSVIVNANGSSQGNFNWMFSTRTDAVNGQNGVGFRTSNSAGALNFKPVNPANDGAGNPQAGTGTAGTPTFIVGRLTLTVGSASNFRIWVNPSTDPSVIPGDSDANSSQTTIAAADTSTLRASISGRAFGSGSTDPAANNIEFDEIRIGTSFADVLPPILGAPGFSLDPVTGVEGQTLTFSWTNLPSGSNPTLNGNTIIGATTPDGSTTLAAPGINTTYSLNWAGAVAPLTQQFTAVAPFLTISPSSAYLGDNLTLNWRVPAGATDITLSPNPGGLDLNTLTNTLTGVGTTPIPAPSASTVYTITWTGLGNGATGVSQSFTLLPSFLNVTPDPVNDGSTITLNWRISPEWDDNATVENNVVTLQSSTFADFSTLGDDFPVSADSATGVGSTTLTATLGLSYFRLVYYIGDVETIVSDAITVFDPYFNNLVYTPTNTAVREHINFGESFQSYTDRPHTWVSVPSVLVGGHYLQTRQGDKTNASLSATFDADPGSTVFVLIDNRVGDGVGGTNPVSGSDNPPVASALPWLAANGFLDSGLDIGSDENNDGSINNTASVFFKQVPVGAVAPETTFNLGSLDTTSPTINDRSVYGVVITKPQVVPVSFHAFPGTFPFAAPVPAGLFWTLPTDATSVSISPTVGSVSIDANGQGSVTVNPIATTTYTLTASSVSLGPISRTTTVTVTGTPPPSGFGTFITGDFGGNTVPALQQGPNDDPDGDGIDNLMEYAIAGGDPTRSTASPAVISGTLVTFSKNTAATGITYALEKSSTLGNDWVPATPTTNDANVITYTLAPPAPTKEFVRLKVTQP